MAARQCTALPSTLACPFSIEQRLRKSNGQFRHGARGTSHVEADGRLITGMNWESTRGVVAAFVQQLDAQSDAVPKGPPNGG